MLKFYKKILDLKNIDLIRKSNYFDEDYYHNEYPEVDGDLAKHYYYTGYKLGYNPSNKFNNNNYLENNLDVKNSGTNPLIHYILYGKSEERKIKKYFGFSISELYCFLYNKEYSYKVYLKKSSKGRVTLFLGDIFGEKDIKLIIETIKYCMQKKYQLRIIYKDIDNDKLLLELSKNKLENFSDLILLKWNSKYLLEIYENEKLICNDFYTLISLINTKIIENPICYYITNKSLLKEEEQMILSLLSQNKNVFCLGNANINSYELVIENNYKKINNKRCNICFDFGCLDILILQLYNEFYKKNLFKYEFNYFYKSNQFNRTICFENNVLVKRVSDFSGIDLVIKFNYHKKNILHDIPCINIYFKKQKEKIECTDFQNINLVKRSNCSYFIKELEKQFKDVLVGDNDV